MNSISQTANHSTTARPIPPMSYPRRIRSAASLAWQTLRTGRHIYVEAYLNGARDGIDTGMHMAVAELAARGTGVPDEARRPR